jgi:hypothetical protein
MAQGETTPERVRKKKKMATGQKEQPALVTHDTQKFILTTFKKKNCTRKVIPFGVQQRTN